MGGEAIRNEGPVSQDGLSILKTNTASAGFFEVELVLTSANSNRSGSRMISFTVIPAPVEPEPEPEKTPSYLT